MEPSPCLFPADVSDLVCENEIIESCILIDVGFVSWFRFCGLLVIKHHNYLSLGVLADI